MATPSLPLRQSQELEDEFWPPRVQQSELQKESDACFEPLLQCHHQTPGEQRLTDSSAPTDRHNVVVVLGLVRPTLLAGVSSGAGRLWSVPVLSGARAAGCSQVEQQNSPASPAGGQCELQR